MKDYTINEIKNYINNSKYYGSFEDFDLSKFAGIGIKFKETIDTDEHRWYVVATNVYKFLKDNQPIGFLAIDEVKTIKSEAMSVEDCYHELKAYNVKKIVKETFEIIEG